MRLLFLSELGSVGSDVDHDTDLAAHLDLYMSYWYAALYVVVEGWRELSLEDGQLDQLLAHPYIELLRRYRNGVFHYRRRYWDERLLTLIREGAASARWVGELHQAFGGYFLVAARRGFRSG